MLKITIFFCTVVAEPLSEARVGFVVIQIKQVTFSVYQCSYHCLFYFYTSFTSEPLAPPANVRGHNTSSTSILVEWDDVPAADQNGIILSYTITYQSVTQNHNSEVTVNYAERQANLTGLKKYLNYSITVFASTVIGDGPASKPVFVITEQDSKCSL